MKTFEQFIGEVHNADNLSAAVGKLEKLKSSNETEMHNHLIARGHSPEVSKEAVKSHVAFQKIVNSPSFARNASLHSHGD